MEWAGMPPMDCCATVAASGLRRGDACVTLSVADIEAGRVPQKPGGFFGGPRMPPLREDLSDAGLRTHPVLFERTRLVEFVVQSCADHLNGDAGVELGRERHVLLIVY